ncbi:MAG: histidinol-phosphate transaminase [Candidatus Methanophagaceae archaeon]|nr:MAG: histidinol-phosphate transaminase [Methanophagales archaeon]
MVRGGGMRIRPQLKDLEEYKPGELIKGAIKLSSNENPLGTSEQVISEIIEGIESGELDLSLYPWSGNEAELKRAIAAYLEVEEDRIVIGAGIDGVLDTLVRIFMGEGDEAIIPIPTFSLYESLIKIAGGTPRYVKREKDFSISLDELISACNDRTRMIFLASPNNPTGNSIKEEDVRAIAAAVPETMVIIDEAYAEFAPSSFSLVRHLREEGDENMKANIVVLRTFSKAFALAGLRIGYAVVPKWLTGIYKRVAMPFSVNSIAIAAAIAALRDKEHLRNTVELVRKGREFLIEHLQPFFNVFPSDANFVLVDVSPAKSHAVYDALLREGIVVRDCSSFRGAGDSLIRITVGTEEQNMRVVNAMKHIHKLFKMQ